MKKILLLAIVFAGLFMESALAQDVHTPGPMEKKLTDSVCGCVSKMDVSKIKTKQEAESAFASCVGQHADILQAVAEERHVELSDDKAMEQVGIDLAFSLMKQKCPGFMQLAVVMGQKDGAAEATTAKTAYGTFKRIDNKGFNYLVISGSDGKQKSFLWLRQFEGSEKFINGGAAYIGKKLKIEYQDLEVYLPEAKGYYTVKEITGVSVL